MSKIFLALSLLISGGGLAVWWLLAQNNFEPQAQGPAFFKPIFSWQYVILGDEVCSETAFKEGFSQANEKSLVDYDPDLTYCLRFNHPDWQYKTYGPNQLASFSLRQTTNDELVIESTNQEALSYEYQVLDPGQVCSATSLIRPTMVELGENILLDDDSYHHLYCVRQKDRFGFSEYLGQLIFDPNHLAVPDFRLILSEQKLMALPKPGTSLTNYEYVVSPEYEGCFGQVFKGQTFKAQVVELTDQTLNQYYCFRAFNGVRNDFDYESIYANNGLVHTTTSGWQIKIDAQVVDLAHRLQLTQKGTQIFFDANPIIYDDAQTFVACCGDGNGFYDGRIHLRGPQIPRLRFGNTSTYGWYESVAAHELLHAVFRREDPERIASLIEPHWDLKDVFVNYYTFGHLYSSFNRRSVISEVHSTIIQKAVVLPPDLEAHYALFFKNRHLIRNFDRLSGFEKDLPKPR